MVDTISNNRKRKKEGRGRPSKLDDIPLPKNELKKLIRELINKFGYTGAARELDKLFGVVVDPNTVRNYAKKLGVKVSAHDIKDGLHQELLDEQACQYLGLDNIEHVGLEIGNGVDVRCEYNGTPIYIESRNWGSGQIDRTVVEKRVIPRFEKAVSKYGKDGIKILHHSVDLRRTKGAKELLEEADINYLSLGHKKVTRKNWREYLERAILKIGLLLNKLLGYPIRNILFALRRAKQEKGNQNDIFALIDALIEVEAFELCIDDDLEFQDQGGGQSRVKSGFKSILKGCRKVLDLVKVIGKNIGRNVGSIVSEFSKKMGWKMFVLDESGRFGLVGKVMGGENLNESFLNEKVDELLSKVAMLADAVKQLIETVSLYQDEISRLDKVGKRLEKMAQGVRKEVRLAQKYGKSRDLAKAALKGADMSEIIKTLDNIGKIRRLEKELRALEAKKDMTIKEVLQKALQGEMTIGEVDRIQRAEAKKERLRREIAVLVGDANGSAGKKKKVRDEFNLVRVG
ncbi:MAG: hypothetical protein H0Z28_02685 [Archaeoglobus sp.]|nr:hypothetical protein [Archaeoglobus sp.]